MTEPTMRGSAREIAEAIVSNIDRYNDPENKTVFVAAMVEQVLAWQREQCAKVRDALYASQEVESAWDEGEATGYQEAASAIRAASPAGRS